MGAINLADADFSGYVTKAGVKCADGRTIKPEAFKHMDGQKVPLVWQHGHKDPKNVLGHVMLEARADGLYGYAFTNTTDQGVNAKALVEHKDIDSFSIWANHLVERGMDVFHGLVREVSLCIVGANPEAKIDNVRIAHSLDPDDYETLPDEFIIHMAQPFDGGTLVTTVEETDEDIDHASMKEVYDAWSEEEKDVVHYMLATALAEAATKAGGSVEQSGITSEPEAGSEAPEGDLTHQEGSAMTHRNVFDQNGGTAVADRRVLSHAEMKEIVADTVKLGSMKAAAEKFALAHGIENLEVLFPDARAVESTPEYEKRRTEWVSKVLNGVRKSPFSRIKSITADITMESARALGYIKGNMKKEEFFSLSSRVTTPATVYKKQKLDRDDIIDIVDFNVVEWMKAEMRLMLEEEIARAILIGDGRPMEDPANPGEPNPDKIKDPAGAAEGAGIRSILNEHDLYATTVTVEKPGDGYSWEGVTDEILLAMDNYKGSGSPTFFTTQPRLSRMLLSRDKQGRKLWRSASELATELGFAEIVPVEVMQTQENLLGIIVNLSDYRLGADRGGETTFFDDFDIDYNQYKYLYETRLSGALTKMKSAVVVLLEDLVTEPVEP